MCLCCLLKKAGWNYLDYEQSPLMACDLNEALFYSVLGKYLSRYGPHFEDEIVESAKSFLPENKRGYGRRLNELEDFFSKRLLAPDSLKRHNINSITLSEAVARVTKAEYDVIDLDPLPAGINCHYLTRKDKITDIVTDIYVLIYHGVPSLEKFIHKYQKPVQRVLTLEIPSFSKRCPAHR